MLEICIILSHITFNYYVSYMLYILDLKIMQLYVKRNVLDCIVPNDLKQNNKCLFFHESIYSRV